MKKYVSPNAITVELFMEDILTESADLSSLYQPDGDIIDRVSWDN